jgi:hypothetical protein
MVTRTRLLTTLRTCIASFVECFFSAVEPSFRRFSFSVLVTGVVQFQDTNYYECLELITNFQYKKEKRNTFTHKFCTVDKWDHFLSLTTLNQLWTPGLYSLATFPRPPLSQRNKTDPIASRLKIYLLPQLPLERQINYKQKRTVQCNYRLLYTDIEVNFVTECFALCWAILVFTSLQIWLGGLF